MIETTTQRLRLSTLMRMGAAHTRQVKKRPFKGSEERPRTPVFACASASARLACHQCITNEQYPYRYRIGRHFSYQDKQVYGDHIPDDLDRAIRMNVSAVIVRLNDHAEWSREKIASWLDAMIDERGYDFRFEVPVQPARLGEVALHALMGGNARLHQPSPEREIGPERDATPGEGYCAPSYAKRVDRPSPRPACKGTASFTPRAVPSGSNK